MTSYDMNCYPRKTMSGAEDSAVEDILPDNSPLLTRNSHQEPIPPVIDEDQKGLKRNLFGYWILGLCNNFSYVVMLSAAHDILARSWNGEEALPASQMAEDVSGSGGMFCRAPHGGAFDISSSGLLWSWACILQWRIGGSFPAFLFDYKEVQSRNVVSTWSSGTGGAGIMGALTYAGLTALGISPRASVLLVLVVPFLYGLTYDSTMTSIFVFFFILVHPEQEIERRDGVVPLSLKRKFQYIPSLLHLMLPLMLVYVAEYFINQGLFELVYFRGISLNHHEQYRWYQVDYQIGVFLSRSSVNIFPIRATWILTILQFGNVVVFFLEAYYAFLPSIAIVFVLIFFEGLLGGAAYVNTFYRISSELEEGPVKPFAMSITTTSDSMGVALAGFISIPVHDLLCRTPLPGLRSR
ncbi:unnamed protein product [Darwinula stevensoni]|uniref:Battenin n=1 Tax=Darwinula stevensoni TaxID=69355 RepID=A0A7R8XJR3_9CRUS|nr:unnamed protein product [Darwinula stevensoni]CAG0895604.1 unnamed protein product [Darwinula stevensoni]